MEKEKTIRDLRKKVIIIRSRFYLTEVFSLAEASILRLQMQGVAEICISGEESSSGEFIFQYSPFLVFCSTMPPSSLETATFFQLHQILNIIYNNTTHIRVEVRTMATMIAATCVFDSFIPVASEHNASGGPHKWSLFRKELSGNPEKVDGMRP
ncbi:hypothetical protein V8G54_008051 [Vigna mungo]|uniref:Uncharacterized protein n=1 Tax=Vigna mungo TaxID=3915 RepID=A0AAQ3P2T7_VIGMU